MTGRLTVDAGGRLRGPAALTYNTPWPCPNGSYGSGAMQGVLMHTMVGNLPGTISVFDDPAYQASAHFGIAQDGSVHQFGPIGKGWIAWHAEAANQTWYGIEHADNGNTHNPLTDAQMTASAQVVECLSNYAGFPLEVTDDVHGKGYGTHVMGGAAFGGHTCPGPGPRAMQRYEIITRAKAIRAAAAYARHVSDGTLTLRQAAAARGITFQEAARRSLASLNTVNAAAFRKYYNVPGGADDIMPRGLVYWL